jgi:hypothetical protein
MPWRRAEFCRPTDSALLDLLSATILRISGHVIRRPVEANAAKVNRGAIERRLAMQCDPRLSVTGTYIRRAANLDPLPGTEKAKDDTAGLKKSSLDDHRRPAERT